MAQHGYSLGFIVFKLNMETIFNSYFHLDGGVELWIRGQRLYDNLHLFTDIIQPSADCRSQKVSKYDQNEEIQLRSVLPNETRYTLAWSYTLHAAILLYITSQKF